MRPDPHIPVDSIANTAPAHGTARHACHAHATAPCAGRHDGDLRLRNSAQRPEVLLFPSPAIAAHGSAPGSFAPPELNAAYYILKRLLPAMDRVFGLLGARARLS